MPILMTSLLLWSAVTVSGAQFVCAVSDQKLVLGVFSGLLSASFLSLSNTLVSVKGQVS